MNIRRAKTIKDWLRMHNLYRKAFPANERKPFAMIIRKTISGQWDSWVLTDSQNQFLGLATTVNWKDIVLLDYFAIAEEKRNSGYGSEALKKLQECYHNKKFILEIERADQPSDNSEERVRRKAFYLRNGMEALGILVCLFGVEMELLAYNCKVSFEEYKGMYVGILGDLAIKNVKQG